jgi:tRNA modification GTPase
MMEPTKSSLSETIAAISTAPSGGAVGILRVSGPETLIISSTILRKTKESISNHPRKAIFTKFYDQELVLDEILFLYFNGPNSYTGEDMAEFHLHGNPILMKKALHVILNHGARPAKPGEFTKRAFLNQKLSLTQAEGVNRIISARSQLELELAQKNVQGELKRISSQLRSELLNVKAELEAEIDFSTEDLTYENKDQRISRIHKVIEICKNCLNQSESVNKILAQNKVVLYGEPNSGKSSLMNLLLGRDRSIISDIAGTTRDYITESMQIDGFPFELVDTAGIRDSIDPIEKQGIQRSIDESKKANVRLFVIDVSISLNWNEFFMNHIEFMNHSIFIFNKFDIISQELLNSNSWKEFVNKIKPISLGQIFVSCKTKEGIKDLVKLIHENLIDTSKNNDYILLEDRQKYHFERIEYYLNKALENIQANIPAEIIVLDINEAIDHIGELNGKVSNEEVLGRIFSIFCVGK